MTSENTKRRSRLFANLLTDELWKHGWQSPLAKPYLTFIKAQRNTRNPWDPYSMACRILQQS